jgi:hypothetical protein
MMKYCPHCRAEYFESERLCSDCKVALVKYEEVPPRCPICKKTYSFEESYCEKCLVDLDFFQKEDNEKLEKEISDEPPEFIEMVTVYETTNLAELSVIKAIFDREHIHYYARGENLQSLFAAGLLGGFNPVIGTMKIDVEKNDVEKATIILKDMFQDGGIDN